jgi:histone acetyltransferase SAS3
MHTSDQTPVNDPAEDSELDAEGDEEFEIAYPQQQDSGKKQKIIPKVISSVEQSDDSSTSEVERSNGSDESEEEEYHVETDEEEEDVESKVSVVDEELDDDDDDSMDSEPVNRKRKRIIIPLKVNGGSESSREESRALRKRKASDAESLQRPLRTRRRPSDLGSTSFGAERSPSILSAQDLDESGRPHRPRRNKRPDQDFVTIKASEGISLIVSFALDPQQMQKILTSRPKKNRYKERKKKILVEPIFEEEQPHYPPIPNSHGSSLIPFLEREIEDTKSKPYGGILTEAEADTSPTFPLAAARQKFEDARLKAEEDWKRKMEETNNVAEPTKPSQKMSGPPSKIKCINFGGFEIDTWNAAPYPEEYSRNKILYICEFCLKYMNSDFVAWRHKVRSRRGHSNDDH